MPFALPSPASLVYCCWHRSLKWLSWIRMPSWKQNLGSAATLTYSSVDDHDKPVPPCCPKFIWWYLWEVGIWTPAVAIMLCCLCNLPWWLSRFQLYHIEIHISPGRFWFSCSSRARLFHRNSVLCNKFSKTPPLLILWNAYRSYLSTY